MARPFFGRRSSRGTAIWLGSLANLAVSDAVRASESNTIVGASFPAAFDGVCAWLFYARLTGLTAGELFPLEGASVVLGRHPACDIVLESAAVSRQHARILNIGGSYYVEDLHSRNGTLLNGRPILQRQPLTENDRLDICDLAFVFYPGTPERYIALPRPPIDRRQAPTHDGR